MTRRRGITLLMCAVLLAALWALSQSAWFVETAYARGVGFQISRVLSIVTGWLPLSLAALVIAGVVAYLLVPFVVTIVKIFRGERRWVEALGAGALRFATFAAVATTVFYLSWGLHYSRAPFGGPARVVADGATHGRGVRDAIDGGDRRAHDAAGRGDERPIPTRRRF